LSILSWGGVWLLVGGVMAYGFICNYGENRGDEKNIWEVLVGAFSDFGTFDTDNPVQIWRFFGDFAVFLFPKGLI